MGDARGWRTAGREGPTGAVDQLAGSWEGEGRKVWVTGGERLCRAWGTRIHLEARQPAGSGAWLQLLLQLPGK